MLRILTLLATVATAATLSGGANAHPPDISVLYGAPSHSSHGYGQPTYSQPVYSQPTYSQPTYTRPSYDATPLYSRTYGTPSYRRPVRRVSDHAARPVYDATPIASYSGFATPSYGYRHGRGHSQPRPQRIKRWSYDRDFGDAVNSPMTESVSYGYVGGPTYGNDVDAVINGVRIYRPRER